MLAKKYDALLIHDESDELWVNKNIKPMLYDYKLSSVKVSSATNPALTAEQSELVRQARRVVIVFTKKFLSEGWKNTELHSLLKDIYANDAYCILIAINVGEVSQEDVNKYMLDIDPSLENNTKLERFRTNLANRITENMGLKDAEILYWHDQNFAKDLSYVMPPVGKTKATHTSYKEVAKPRVPSPVRATSPVLEKRYSIGSNDLPLITSLTKSIEESMRRNPRLRVHPVNNVTSQPDKLG